MFKLVSLAAAALFAFSAEGFAQTTDAGPIEISGGAAFHQLWDDESSIGTGVAGGGAISLALSDRLRVRGRVMGFRNERDFGNGVIFEATGVRYTADVLWQPSSSPHSLYFGAAAGGFSYTRTSRFPIEPFQAGQARGPGSSFARSGTDSIVGGLVGFTAFSSDRFRLHPETSIWWSRPGYFIVIEVGILASYRF